MKDFYKELLIETDDIGESKSSKQLHLLMALSMAE